MPQSPSLFQPIEQQNRCSDCLSLGLEELPGPPGAPGTAQIDLHATLTFNTQWQSLLDGRVKLSLTGGRLQLQFENAKLLASGALAGAMEDNSGRAVKTGSSQAPCWVFTSDLAAIALSGTIESVQLGRLQVIERPCHVSAAFEVLPQNLYISDAEGLWSHDISPNKHAILERTLVKFLHETRFSPAISQVHWYYGDENPGPKPNGAREDADCETKLRQQIETLCTAQTDNFLELAKLAGLDPLADLAGGNLLGTDLSELDLSGATFQRVNLRGAVLSDTDLSEADLQGAKLSGADFSGAYLSSANLSGADLHKASLALANLGGANLQATNFKEANLSNINLTSARVERARFGSNPGLTEELKRDLQQRGAIVEEG